MSLPGLLQEVTGSNDGLQDLEQPELVPVGDLWTAEVMLGPLGLMVQEMAAGALTGGVQGGQREGARGAALPFTP